MGPRQTQVPVRGRVCGIAASLFLLSGVVAGCGPSQDEIRADINEVCVDLIRDLSKLEAEPGFEVLAIRANEAGYEHRMAAYEVREVSKEGAADEFASALDALNDSYRDLEEQLTWRDYASLARTRQGGEAALADALAAGESLAATDCAGIGVRVGYFAIAADDADAAAAAMAPSGDYVTDVNAACARFADDTFAVRFKLGLQSALDIDTGTTSARDYLEAIEELGVVTTALGLLIDDLAGLVPPASLAAAHEGLIEGYTGATEGFRSLGDGEEGDPVGTAAEQVEKAAELLGVECSL